MRNSGRRSNGSSVRNGVMCNRGRRSGRPRRRRVRAAVGRRGSFTRAGNFAGNGILCFAPIFAATGVVLQRYCPAEPRSAASLPPNTLLRNWGAKQNLAPRPRCCEILPDGSKGIPHDVSCCATPCSAKFARQLRCSAEPCSETGALRRTLPGDRVGETLLENFVLAQECLFRKFCCTTAPYPTPPNRIARPAPENPSGRSVAAQKRRAAGTGPCLFFPTDQFSLFY
ncbi:hypothetical protein Cdeb_02856 [Caldibacillus debilis GB1]|uniref:Uncharacterized protein n=1 Tax=Caldibacillus debilis GB1 TaxID=1339248 RepID=A0A420VJS1_9BACI|nr:hypothetical protein Cdeb_02856 [Caldibacillus debilis GB1]